MATNNPTTKDYSKLTAYCLVFITIVLFIFILKSLASIIIPFVIAAFLAFMFDPVLEYFCEKFKMPRWGGIVVVFLIVSGLLYLVGLIVYSTLAGSAFQSEQMVKIITDLQTNLDLFIASTGQKIGLSIPKLNLQESVKGALSLDIISSSLATFSAFLFNFAIVIVLWLFMIAGKPEFESKLYYALSKRSSGLEDTIKLSVKQIQSYIFAQTMINLGNAIVNMIVFYIFDVQFAALWGLIIFLLNYIPNIGPVIAVIPPIALTLATGGLTVSTVSLVIILIFIQFFEGNVITPKVMGFSMDLSTVFVMVSVFFWGYVWGITGAFLAVPIAAVIKILVSNIPLLKPFALVLSSQPKPPRKNKKKEGD